MDSLFVVLLGLFSLCLIQFVLHWVCRLSQSPLILKVPPHSPHCCILQVEPGVSYERFIIKRARLIAFLLHLTVQVSGCLERVCSIFFTCLYTAAKVASISFLSLSFPIMFTSCLISLVLLSDISLSLSNHPRCCCTGRVRMDLEEPELGCILSSLHFYSLHLLLFPPSSLFPILLLPFLSSRDMLPFRLAFLSHFC